MPGALSIALRGSSACEIHGAHTTLGVRRRYRSLKLWGRVRRDGLFVLREVNKAITKSPFGEDVLWVGRVFFDLLA